MIEDLPLVTPDRSRSAPPKPRGHQTQAARRRKLEARHRQPNPRALGTERLLVAGFCVAYLIAMAGDLLAIAAQR